MALGPENPERETVIRKISENIVTLSAPFSRVGRFDIGGRATIVKLPSGSLAVFSPVTLTQGAKDIVKELGNQVKYLIALDYEHHLFLGEWYDEYSKENPDVVIQVIGPEGLPEKRRRHRLESVPFTTIFTARNKVATKIDPEFDAVFKYEYVDAHPNKEIVFFYEPEKTLIEADLIFNLPASEQYSKVIGYSPGFLTQVFDWLFSAQGSAQSKVIWLGSRNSERYKLSIQTIDTWDFTRLIPCHGDVLEEDGKIVFRRLMRRQLGLPRESRPRRNGRGRRSRRERQRVR